MDEYGIFSWIIYLLNMVMFHSYVKSIGMQPTEW